MPHYQTAIHEPQYAYNCQPVGLRSYFDDSISRRLWMRSKGTMDGYDAHIDQLVSDFLTEFQQRQEKAPL